MCTKESASRQCQAKESPAHFKGKDAIGHVIEAQAQGLVSSSEIHGTEVPGHLAAGSDAARETALILLFLSTLLLFAHVSNPVTILIVFASGWIIWKLGRSAWLGWIRLERLHRILAQEKWEIEHNRQQERDELRELYRAKGFQDKLLEDVLDVLMADDNRLLKVMVEEELGLTLATHEHPLKQGLGAFIGALLAAVVNVSLFWLYGESGILFSTLLLLGSSGYLIASQSQNRTLPAIVWNIGIGMLAYAFLYFLLQYFLG